MHIVCELRFRLRFFRQLNPKSDLNCIYDCQLCGPLQNYVIYATWQWLVHYFERSRPALWTPRPEPESPRHIGLATLYNSAAQWGSKISPVMKQKSPSYTLVWQLHRKTAELALWKAKFVNKFSSTILGLSNSKMWNIPCMTVSWQIMADSLIILSSVTVST